MNPAQVTFLGGFVAVLAVVGAYSFVVVRSAVAGGRVAGLGVVGRRTEHSRAGRVAFLAHRLTGFAIFAFLCLHIVDVALYSISRRLYDDVQPIYGTAPLRLFECCLLFAVLFHAGNGLRLIAVDGVRLSTAWTRRLLLIVAVGAAASGLAGSAVILAPLFR